MPRSGLAIVTCASLPRSREARTLPGSHRQGIQDSQRQLCRSGLSVQKDEGQGVRKDCDFGCRLRSKVLVRIGKHIACYTKLASLSNDLQAGELIPPVQEPCRHGLAPQLRRCRMVCRSAGMTAELPRFDIILTRCPAHCCLRRQGSQRQLCRSRWPSQ